MANNYIYINEKMYNDLLDTDEKSVAQVICDTEVLKEVYEMMRSYIFNADKYSREEVVVYTKRLTEQIKIIVTLNSRAKSLYRWLFDKEFSKDDSDVSNFMRNSEKRLAELRALVKKWDDDEQDADLLPEALENAFRFQAENC